MVPLNRFNYARVCLSWSKAVQINFFSLKQSLKKMNEFTGEDVEINFNVDVGENGADASETVDISKQDGEEVSEKILRLPVSRVKKIMKIDPDVSLASREAVFLITKATELLLDSLAKEAYAYTAVENKKTVTKKHLDSAISNIDALAFLDGTLD